MAVTQLEFGGALVLGIAPALAFLYWSLRRFDRPFTQYTLFDDRRVFGGLAVGMIFGVLATVLDTAALTLAFEAISLLGILFAISLVDELFKLVYLNRRGYSGRFDTTFYGVAIGVGAAATTVVGIAVWGALQDIEAAQGLEAAGKVGSIVLFSVSLNLVNADTGALIGFGAAHGDMWRSFARALGLRYAHALLLLPPFLFAFPLEWGLVSESSSLALAAIVYHYVYTQVLPGTLPDKIRREMRRERRARPVKE